MNTNTNIDVKDYKRFVKNLDDDEIDVVGDDYTSCWMFAYYFHCKYGLPLLNYEPVYEVENQIEFRLIDNGIYSYFMSHNKEMHHFILSVNNNKLTLMSTYGGQKNIINITYDKIYFIDKFNELMNIDGDVCMKIKKYCELFGIKKVCFDDFDISTCKLSYTYKEHTECHINN